MWQWYGSASEITEMVLEIRDYIRWGDIAADASGDFDTDNDTDVGLKPFGQGSLFDPAASRPPRYK